MFAAMKSLFRSSSKTSQTEHEKHIADTSKGLPLGMTPSDFSGMRLGGMVSLNMLEMAAFDEFLFDSTWSKEFQEISAIGVVNLGAGEYLTRFYLSNDTWIQAAISNGVVFEYQVYDFFSAEDVSDREFDDLINHVDGAEEGKENRLGEHQLTVKRTGQNPLDGVFDRVWGSNDSAWSPPVMLEEVVTQKDTGQESQVSHHCMLYRRHIESAERYEYAFLSGESVPAEGSFQIVTNVGIDITSLIIEAH